MVSTVELRALGEVPTGARVQGIAWTGKQQIEARCPCDPGTALGVHIRGQRLLPLSGKLDELCSLDLEQRAFLVALFPWINEPLVPDGPTGILDRQEHETDDLVDDLADQFDLDPQDAEFLKELLADD
jgi:hypothetical protein